VASLNVAAAAALALFECARRRTPPGAEPPHS
jgi:tRNA G18 (ribose-2'-O)-methylase SpoU